MDLLSPANTPRPAQINAALLILRIASALAFLYHGSAILFGAFGGPGPQGFAAFMHMPAIAGYLVGLAQVAGGLAILSGALIRTWRGVALLSSCSERFSWCTCPTVLMSQRAASNTRSHSF
jgi:uncharacterized membrane protein YphA (DoxX/SURF4 family)